MTNFVNKNRMKNYNQSLPQIRPWAKNTMANTKYGKVANSTLRGLLLKNQIYFGQYKLVSK